MQQTFREQLASMKEIVQAKEEATAPKRVPGLPPPEGKDDLRKLMESVQNLMKELDSSKPKLEALQKYPGRLGDCARAAIRTTPGVVGPMQKFVKELRRAVEEMEKP